MRYSRSFYRNSFDARINFLVKKARRAHRLKASDADIRDLVFQSAIFLTGAAIETYIRLLVEAWIQRIRLHDMGSQTPSVARAYIALRRLESSFAKYQYNGDERTLYMSLQAEGALWPLLAGDSSLPSFFEGKALHDGTTYPSHKNIKRLFARVGIDNMLDRLSRNLSRDAEALIENFQSVRTALAHSSPPTITILDVEARLSDSKALIGAIDRIFHGHVMRHGGSDCWST